MVVKLQLPPTLIIGGGASQQAAAEAQRLGIERPLLVVDPYLRDSQPAALLAAALPTAIFSGVTPDPDLDVVAAGLAALRAHDADGIVALGGMAFSNASVALVHGMSRPLGAFFHIPHGLSNAMLLPAITRFSLSGNPERYAAFAAHTGLGADVLAALVAFNQDLHVPTLRGYGVPEAAYRAAMPQMAEDALASGSPANNPRVPSKDEILTLYAEVYS